MQSYPTIDNTEENELGNLLETIVEDNQHGVSSYLASKKLFTDIPEEMVFNLLVIIEKEGETALSEILKLHSAYDIIAEDISSNLDTKIIANTELEVLKKEENLQNKNYPLLDMSFADDLVGGKISLLQIVLFLGAVYLVMKIFKTKS